MKAIQYILMLIVFCSCVNNAHKMDLNGNWLIKKMYYRGKSIYPKGQTSGKITLQIEGYENYEKIEFRTEDSTVILPGFDSEELCMNFKTADLDSISIDFDTQVFDMYKTRSLEKKQMITSRGSLSNQYDFANSIYCGKYEVLADSNRGLLLLSSNKTSILLVSEQFLLDQRIEKMFKGL